MKILLTLRLAAFTLNVIEGLAQGDMDGIHTRYLYHPFA